MRAILRSLIAVGVLSALVALSPARAQENETREAPLITIDEERLIERVKQAILEALIDDGLLGEEIDKGIRAYVQKQREAKQSARVAAQQRTDDLAKDVRRVSAERDHIFGSPDALVSLIEYSDFECPYCKRFHKTAKGIVVSYNGTVNWVYRHYPLNFHNPGAQKQAEASECSAKLGGNEAFWRFTDSVFERTRSGGKGFPLDRLVPLAEEIGLDGQAFRDCLDSGQMTARVQEDFDEGSRIGVRGTPANILINNQTGDVKLVKGAASAEVLKAAIDSLLQ